MSRFINALLVVPVELPEHRPFTSTDMSQRFQKLWSLQLITSPWEPSCVSPVFATTQRAQSCSSTDQTHWAGAILPQAVRTEKRKLGAGLSRSCREMRSAGRSRNNYEGPQRSEWQTMFPESWDFCCQDAVCMLYKFLLSPWRRRESITDRPLVLYWTLFSCPQWLYLWHVNLHVDSLSILWSHWHFTIHSASIHCHHFCVVSSE